MKKILRVIPLFTSLLLYSCSSYNFFKIYHADYEMNTFKGSDIFESEETYKTLFTSLIDDTNTVMKENENNAIFSPISFYNALTTASLLSNNGLNFMSKFGYSSESEYQKDFLNISKALLMQQDNNNYIKSINFVDYLNINTLNEDFLIETGEKYDISSFNYPLASDLASYTMEFIKNVINIDVSLSPELLSNVINGAFAFNCLKVKDKSSYDLTEEKQTFRNLDGTSKEMEFVSDNFRGKFYNDEENKVYIFDLNIYPTNLMIILPYEGVDINIVNLNRLDLFLENAEEMTLHVNMPPFSLSSGLVNYSYLLDKYDFNYENKPYDKSIELVTKDTSYFDESLFFTNFYQSATFSFDENGIEGEAVSIIGAGDMASDPSYDLEIDVDRPFYAISLYKDLPLFVNKITNL